MPNEAIKSSKRVLEPNERISEVLFGLIMVLTYTGSLSIAEAGHAEVRTMLIGALGCNIAWGIIDAVFYFMTCLSEQGRNIRSLRALQKAPSPEAAHRVIADALPPMVAATMGPAEYETVRRKLAQMPKPPRYPRLSKDEWLGGFMVFLLVFVSTFPVAVPFIFMDEVGRAMRVSNGIAIVLLFVCGHAFGRTSEGRPWLTGLAMVIIGSVLVGLTIALEG
jgi:VIT1/CCC1 family predicted Fe2+/Mn2+ transporter